MCQKKIIRRAKRKITKKAKAYRANIKKIKL